MPEDLRTPILKVVLKENDNLALIFPQQLLETFDLYFFRVMRRKILHRTYDSELSAIAANSTLDFSKFGKTAPDSGDDILECWKERPWRILHFASGIRPSEIWWYQSQPADQEQTGWAYETPSKITDKFDGVPGFLSPYDCPTVATEMVTYYKSSIYPGLRNDSDRSIRPSVRFLGAGYDCLQLTDPTEIDKMIAGRVPCRFVTVGGLAFFTYTVPDKWKAATQVNSATIERVLGGAYR